ncbi:hypothetical protein C7M84_019021 [Penaeus vannamei]|uniref:Uncharacterized protein n=1 Tax=Penaeus vannamei TaxID=6689 RepID=A0A3R7LU86_PENVA|nr:hypothetical protein C7M84_019021 [Penaeus vannamei]
MPSLVHFAFRCSFSATNFTSFVIFPSSSFHSSPSLCFSSLFLPSLFSSSLSSSSTHRERPPLLVLDGALLFFSFYPFFFTISLFFISFSLSSFHFLLLFFLLSSLILPPFFIIIILYLFLPFPPFIFFFLSSFFPAPFSSSPSSSSTHQERRRPWPPLPFPAVDDAAKPSLVPAGFSTTLSYLSVPPLSSSHSFPSSYLPLPPLLFFSLLLLLLLYSPSAKPSLVHCAFPCWFSTTLSYLFVLPPSSSHSFPSSYLPLFPLLFFSLLLLLYSPSAKPSLVHCAFPCWFSTTLSYLSVPPLSSSHSFSSSLFPPFFTPFLSSLLLLLLLVHSPSAKPSLVHCAFPCWFSTTHLSRTSSPSVTSTLSGFTRNFCSRTAQPAKGTRHC